MRNKEITISDDRRVVITELPLGKFGALLSAIKELPDRVDFSDFGSSIEDEDKSEQEDRHEAIGAKFVAALPALLASGWDQLMGTVKDSTDLSEKDINENVSINDGLKIIEAMIEVNDISAIVKTIGQWFGKIKKKRKEQAGSTKPSTPSQKDTAGHQA